MKYIIELPDEFAEATKEYWDKTVGLQLEPYVESGRKVIEDEVWDFVKKIECLTISEIGDCFDVEYEGVPFVANMFSFQEAKDKYEEWKKEKEEIRVGDEIVSELTKTRGVVFAIDAWDAWYGVSENGCAMDITADMHKCWKKTGRYFPEIGQMLEKMKE